MKVEEILKMDKWERRKTRQGFVKVGNDRRHRSIKLAEARIRWDRMLAEGRA